MEFESLNIKISDLPKEISVSVSKTMTDEQLKEIAEDLRSQILYNSRNEDIESPSELNVTVVDKQLPVVIFKATL